MAVKLSRTGWVRLFTQMRSPTSFLSRMFTMKAGGAYKGDKVTMDIERYGEQVAVAIKKFTGPNLNDFQDFTDKEFEPPMYSEAFPVNVNDLVSRLAGMDPYDAAYTSYASQLMVQIAKGYKLVSDKIDRSIELQASQILQTGQLNLIDEDGNINYSLDFKPKATHFPTVAIAWSSAATATPVDDLSSLARVIRSDGKVDPDMLIFGRQAILDFMQTDQAKELLDNRRIELGGITPRNTKLTNSGATFYGRIWIGSYNFDMWVYDEMYEHPQTGVMTSYIDDDKVVMLSSSTRLDLTTAEVPLPLGIDPRVAGLMPPRITSREAGFDVTPNLYPTPNGKQIMGEIETRPLLLPVQIDGFGCLDVTP